MQKLTGSEYKPFCFPNILLSVCASLVHGTACYHLVCKTHDSLCISQTYHYVYDDTNAITLLFAYGGKVL